MKRSPVKPLVILLASMAVTAQAADLKAVANAAWSHDGTWQAARQNWEASQQILVQGRAMLLPTIDAKYGHYKNDRDLEDSGLNLQYDETVTSVTLTQPLFRLDAFYGYKEAKASVSAEKAQFYQARQDFVLRVAKRYFGVLRAWDNLVSARAEEKAIGRQLEQTKERFKVGLVPGTDVQEAQATYDLTQVNLIVAKQNFSIARDKLEALTGRKWSQLAELQEQLPMSGPQPSSMEAWLDKAAYQNPNILVARYNAKAAHLTAKRRLGAMLPKVQLVGSYNHQHIAPDGSLPSAMLGSSLADSEGTRVGIEITMPLFHGGALNSQRKQALLRAQAADSIFQQTIRDVAQRTRSAYRTVKADALRVKARRQAIQSARSALEATRSGYQVGTRNVVDVLNAERALYDAQRDYANARYDYIIDSLTLKSAAGELDVADLVGVNGWLSAQDTLNLYNPDLDGQSEAMIPDDA